MILASAAVAEAQYTSRVAAASIVRPAIGLPEYKSDPHNPESEGNQLSGVVRVMHQDVRGWYWFGTQNGLCRHDGSALVYFDIRDAHNRGVTIKTIVENDGGMLWFGHSGGLTRYDGESFTTYTRGDGLISDDVWCTTFDRDGSLWIGTTAGVSRFRAGAFEDFLLPPTKKNPGRGVSSPFVVWSIIQDRAGDMWFAAEGRVYRFDGEELSTVSIMDEASATHVNEILQDEMGRIWFATNEKGVILLEGDQLVDMTGELGWKDAESRALLEDSHGIVWFAAEGRGICRSDGSAVVRVPKLGLAERHETFRLSEDDRGRIWSVGFGGAYRFDGETWVNVTRDGPWR